MSRQQIFWYWVPFLIWALLIYWLSSRSHVPGEGVVPDYAGHIVVYGILTVLAILPLTRGFTIPLSPTGTALAILLPTLYGITDEWHQSFVPNRTPSLRDWLFDAAAAIVVVLLYRKLRPR